MGVSGSGKTTVAALLSGELGVPFLDADDLHPLSNIAKLEAGEPLTDADRRPWLQAVNDAWLARGGGVLACSALKREYREILLQGIPAPVVVYLRGPKGLIRQRLAARQGHFAARSILDSQFDDLEEPADAITVDVGQPPEEVAAEAARRIRGEV